jgi:hypothetical protein
MYSGKQAKHEGCNQFLWSLLGKGVLQNPANAFREMKMSFSQVMVCQYHRMYNCVSQPLFHEGTLKLIFLIQTNPCLRKRKQTDSF